MNVRENLAFTVSVDHWHKKRNREAHDSLVIRLLPCGSFAGGDDRDDGCDGDDGFNRGDPVLGLVLAAMAVRTMARLLLAATLTGAMLAILDQVPRSLAFMRWVMHRVLVLVSWRMSPRFHSM